jgi:hypothetical protein
MQRLIAVNREIADSVLFCFLFISHKILLQYAQIFGGHVDPWVF